MHAPEVEGDTRYEQPPFGRRGKAADRTEDEQNSPHDGERQQRSSERAEIGQRMRASRANPIQRRDNRKRGQEQEQTERQRPGPGGASGHPEANQLLHSPPGQDRTTQIDQEQSAKEIGAMNTGPDSLHQAGEPRLHEEQKGENQPAEPPPKNTLRPGPRAA